MTCETFAVGGRRGAPASLGGGARPLLRGAAARSREAASTAQGPAQQGWGPDGSAGGAGRHAPWRCFAALALAALCACATDDGAGPHAGATPPRPPLSIPEGTDVAGVVHVVRPGQNVYRIAKAYGLEPDDLMRTNGIDDPRTLAVGQELFVPGATRVLDVEPAPGFAGSADPAPVATRVDPAAVRRAPAESSFAWPLKGVLYGRYGKRGGRNHDGIDIAAPHGTPVTAAADGDVVFVGVQSGYGKVVILRHDGGLVTVYAHNSAILVREGARVRQGQPVAKVGQTGRTTGPHLHFEVRDGVKPRDPLRYLP